MTSPGKVSRWSLVQLQALVRQAGNHSIRTAARIVLAQYQMNHIRGIVRRGIR